MNQAYSTLQDIPGYVAILQAVLKSQIQLLVNQLQEQTGEETLILTASTKEGTLCHLGSDTGQGFLQGREEIKSQFLAHCLKENSPGNSRQGQYPLYFGSFESLLTQDPAVPIGNKHQKRKLSSSGASQLYTPSRGSSDSEPGCSEGVTKKLCSKSSSFISDYRPCVDVSPTVQELCLQPEVIENHRVVNNDRSKPIILDAKDKAKKTLSSKIQEITERIKTKDEVQKLQTVEGSITVSIVEKPDVELGLVDTSLDLSNESQPSRCLKDVNRLNDTNSPRMKDVSRASHRKPKLPRFNIGVASDDEDNSQEKVVSEGEDILDVTISVDDTDNTFAQVSLDELGEGVLLKENVTDIPIVGYYNGEDNKSDVENVVNLKPVKNPHRTGGCKSDTVIVSGACSEKNWVKCSMCPDKFPSMESLNFHLEHVTHTPKKYQCDFCGRKFGQLRDMERHRRIHTGERPFTCEICNKSFARKDNLKSHKMKHFKKDLKI